MKISRPSFGDVNEYISVFPEKTQKILQRVRRIVKKAAPKAEERISYQIPAYKLNGKYLVYFAAYEHHVAMYPLSSGMEKVIPGIEEYWSGKATAKFPLNEPIPFDLIQEIVEFKVADSKGGK